MDKPKPVVSIVMGSDSDLPTMTETARMLQKFGVPFEIEISSAHRSPARTAAFAREAAGRGIKAIIAGAGGAFHLAGVIAAETTLPVIAVPMDNSALNGLDALLAAVQMPGGIPVGTMAIGKAGATNAGVYAAQIVATSDAEVSKKLTLYKEELARGVAEKNEKLQRDFKL